MTTTKLERLRELKPCPFCGSAAEIVYKGPTKDRRGSIFVSCPVCWARAAKKHRIKGADVEIEKEAMDAWNGRVGDK